MSHIAEPFVEINPSDATNLGIGKAHLAKVSTAYGQVILRASVTARQPAGGVFVPMHWTDQFASKARVGALMARHTDPISGQPELKHSPASVEPYRANWYAYAVLQEQPDPGAFSYAAVAPCKGGWRAELAGEIQPDTWDHLAVALLKPAGQGRCELLSYLDNSRGQYRVAAFDNGVCVGLLYVGKEPVSVSRTWAVEQLGRPFAADERFRLLAGRPGADVLDRGAIVCACFDVGANEITSAIAQQGCRSVDVVGLKTRAGTNCGSCRAEIRRLIHDAALAKAV